MRISRAWRCSRRACLVCKLKMATTRSYPRGRDFAHVLGYVAKASEMDLERLSEGANAQERAAIRRLFKHPDMRTGSVRC